MATLGALWSQQLGFTITTTTGTVYTHALGYTPTVVILTPFGTNAGVSQGAPFYTAAGTNFITIGAFAAVANVDVTVGSFHSLIK
jgi:hypothetical protein